MSTDQLFGIQLTWHDGKFCDKPVSVPTKLPSSFQVGDEVEFELDYDNTESKTEIINAIIQCVKFSAHTVRYDLALHVTGDVYAVVPDVRART
jgi:hypothetical protein